VAAAHTATQSEDQGQHTYHDQRRDSNRAAVHAHARQRAREDLGATQAREQPPRRWRRIL
jgi:hypothetical protein